MLQIHEMDADELELSCFANFKRYHEVKQCWRKIDGKWMIKDNSFTDEWDEADYIWLVECLKNTINTHGVVYFAREGDQLVGFCSVQGERVHLVDANYLELSCLHVSCDKRGKHIGSKLFTQAARWAKENGADKLYLSAHSSVESQAFYRAMGCVEATEYWKEKAEAEPCDCQMEYLLK